MYAFYQFWLNQDDADAGRFLRVFSFRSREEIEALDAATAERPHERAAQRALARELTVLVHGEDAWARAARTSEALFGRGRLDEADPAELEVALGDAPTVELDGAAELPTYAELFQRAGLVASISEAVRLAAGGGLSVNDEKVDDVRQRPAPDDFLGGRLLVLSRGRGTVRWCGEAAS